MVLENKAFSVLWSQGLTSPVHGQHASVYAVRIGIPASGLLRNVRYGRIIFRTGYGVSIKQSMQFDWRCLMVNGPRACVREMQSGLSEVISGVANYAGALEFPYPTLPGLMGGVAVVDFGAHKIGHVGPAFYRKVLESSDTGLAVNAHEHLQPTDKGTRLVALSVGPPGDYNHLMTLECNREDRLKETARTLALEVATYGERMLHERIDRGPRIGVRERVARYC